MNRSVLCGVLCLAILQHSTVGQDTIPAPKPAGIEDVGSYALGLQIGSQLGRQGFVPNDIDAGSVTSGLMDAISKAKPKLTNEQISAALSAIDAKLQARMEVVVRKRQEELQAIAGPNAEKAKAFLAENAKKEGIKQLPSGLQYKVIKSGDGQSPGPNNTVSVHYTGKLINGKVFDSSVERGRPAQFGVGQVIKGWTEGLQKMKVGDKWMLFIPPELGYGLRGSPSRNPSEPPTIGPNELLIFEVELLAIVK